MAWYSWKSYADSMWLFVVDIFASPVHLATCYTLELYDCYHCWIAICDDIPILTYDFEPHQYQVPSAATFVFMYSHDPLYDHNEHVGCNIVFGAIFFIFVPTSWFL